MRAGGGGSAAIPIVRPSPSVPSSAPGSALSSPVKASAALPSTAAGTSSSKLCKNVQIYGHCKYEGKGCAYAHQIEQLKSSLAASTTSSTHTPTSSRPSTPLTPANPSLAALAAFAKDFVPKSSSAAAAATPTSVGGLSATSAAFNPGSAPFKPAGAAGKNLEVSPAPAGGQARLREESYNTVDSEDLFDEVNPYATPSSHSAQLAPESGDALTTEHDYAYDPSSYGSVSGAAGEEGSVAPGIASGGYYGSDGIFHSNLTMLGSGSLIGPDGRSHLAQPLMYHLYQPPLPHVSPAPAPAHPSAGAGYASGKARQHQHAPPPSATQIIQHFFMSPSLRTDLLTRQAVLSTSLPGPGQRLPFDNPDLPPHERPLGAYWGFIPLDKKYPPEPTRMDASGSRVLGGSISAGIYGTRTWCWRCTDEESGRQYAARRVEGIRLSSEHGIATIDRWSRVKHPNLVGVKEAFTSRAFGDNSIVFIYDYHPLSSTLLEIHLTSQARGAPPPPAIPERVLWSYLVQLAGAIRTVHSHKLAVRCLDPSKILLTGQNRVRINCAGILDVIAHDPSPSALAQQQQEDLLALGKLFLSLGCHSLSAIHSIPQSIEVLARRSYSQEFSNAVLYLLSKPNIGRKSIDEFLGLISARVVDELAGAFDQADLLENELQRELENARLVRLMAKLGFINERPEYDHDPRWAETGDRYIIKLFRDYLYHQVDEMGRPVIDLSHVLTCLNKLDAGVDEQLTLFSRDEQSCLIVSYREVKNCLENSFRELAR